MAPFTVAFVVKLFNEAASPMKGLIKDITSVGKVAAEAAKPVAGVGNAVNEAVAPAKEAAKAAAELGQALATVPAPAQHAGQAVQGAGEKIEDAGKKADVAKGRWASFGKHLATSLVADVTMGVGAILAVKTAIVTSVTGIAVWTRGQAQSAEATMKAAQSAGVSAESYQRLAYAFKQSNLDVSLLDRSVSALSHHMTSAQAGGKEQAALFKAIGVRVKDASGHYKTYDVILGEVADKFAAMKDGVRKTDLAQRLFGESGAEMIPLLNGGAKGLKAAGDEAAKLGLILSNETLTASQKMNAVWDLTTNKLQGLGMTVFAGVLPSMTDLVKTVSDIIEQNKGDIVKGLNDGMKWLKDHMPEILSGTKQFFGFLKDVVNISTAVLKAIGGINGVLDIFGVLMIGKVAFSIGSAIVSVWGFNAALLGCPVVWIIAGIAAIAAGAFLLIRHWKGVSKFFGDLWTGVVATFTAAWTAVSNFFGDLWAGIKATVAEAIKWVSDHFMSLPLPLKLLALPALIIAHWKEISGFFAGLFAAIGRIWAGLPVWAQVIISLPMTIVTHWSFITGFFGALWKKVYSMAALYWNQVMAFVIGIWDKISSAWSKAASYFGGIWQSIKSAFKAGVDGLWNALPGWFQQVLKGIAFAVKVVTGGPDQSKDLGEKRKNAPRPTDQKTSGSDGSDTLPGGAGRDVYSLPETVSAAARSASAPPTSRVAAVAREPLPVRQSLGLKPQNHTFNGQIGLTINGQTPVRVDRLRSSPGLDLSVDRGSMVTP